MSRTSANLKLPSRFEAETSQLGVVPRKSSVVIDRAVEVIGDEAQALRWMGTPVRALDYATPISLLHLAQGRKAVLNVLGQLEHGIV
jgi:putative toxin-antitoxin system antitoxin component (TIGR02293 family)